MRVLVTDITNSSSTVWSSSNTQVLAPPQPPPNGGIYQASTLEPSAENTALMSLLDSDPASKALLDNALNNPLARATTSSDTPSETWPFQGTHAFIGGDAGLIEKELNINAETGSPSAANSWNLGDVFPLSSVWAGAPQGTPWNIPTAALQNAALQFFDVLFDAGQLGAGDRRGSQRVLDPGPGASAVRGDDA